MGDGPVSVPQVLPEQPVPERAHVTPLLFTSFWTVAVKPIEAPVVTLGDGGPTLTEITETTKFIALLAAPPTLTTTLPVVAFMGTGTVI